MYQPIRDQPHYKTNEATTAEIKVVVNLQHIARVLHGDEWILISDYANRLLFFRYACLRLYNIRTKQDRQKSW